MECVPRVKYIAEVRTFPFSFTNSLAKIKVVELGACLLTERAPSVVVASPVVRAVGHPGGLAVGCSLSGCAFRL